MEFFWLIPQKIAGGSLPKEFQDIEQLEKKKIRHIISLIMDPHKIQEFSRKYDIIVHNIPIKDWGVPSHSQIQQFLSIITENLANDEATFVHCLGGCGRTGTMLALYLVQSGYTSADALEELRLLRPCSVETEEQEHLIINFERKN
ncbi:MAG: phosphatase domain-containing protein [Promethearchaeota archaeon]